MNVVSIDPKAKTAEKNKADMLEVLEEMRRQVEEGIITEFVAASFSVDGDAQVHAMVNDLPGAVGLFEMGKFLIIEQQI